VLHEKDAFTSHKQQIEMNVTNNKENTVTHKGILY